MFATLVVVLLAQPASFENSYRAGLLALNRNDLHAAEKNLEAAGVLHPRDARVWLALAQAYWKDKQPTLSGKALAKAEQFAGDDATVFQGIVYLASERGEPKRVITFVHRLPGWEQRGDLRAMLAQAYEAVGDFPHAAAEFEQALKLNPYVESNTFDYAHALLQHQDGARAIQVLEAGRKTFDKSAQIALALGVAYYTQRRQAEAVDAFLQTIALAPDVVQPYVFLGKILDQADARMGEVTARFVQFEKANPVSYLGYYLHAKALSQQGEDAELAEKLLRKSIALDGAQWESHFELGSLLEQRRAFEEAERELKRAIELNPKDPAPYYRLARVYDRLGRKPEADRQRALHDAATAAEKDAMHGHSALQGDLK